MRNQKAINESRFRRVHWRYEEGVFHGSTSIQRQPFGEFEVKIFVTVNAGDTAVEIKAWDMPILSEERKAYPSFIDAVMKVEEYFQGIDGYAKRIPKKVNAKANQFRQELIRNALKEAMEEGKNEL